LYFSVTELNTTEKAKKQNPTTPDDDRRLLLYISGHRYSDPN